MSCWNRTLLLPQNNMIIRKLVWLLEHRLSVTRVESDEFTHHNNMMADIETQSNEPVFILIWLNRFQRTVSIALNDRVFINNFNYFIEKKKKNQMKDVADKEATAKWRSVFFFLQFYAIFIISELIGECRIVNCMRCFPSIKTQPFKHKNAVFTRFLHIPDLTTHYFISFQIDHKRSVNQTGK